MCYVECTANSGIGYRVVSLEIQIIPCNQDELFLELIPDSTGQTLKMYLSHDQLMLNHNGVLERLFKGALHLDIVICF